MKIDIHSQRTRLSEFCRSWMEQQSKRAFHRFVGRIRNVKLRVSDLNGKRGGVDKQCLLILRLEPKGEIVVQRRAPSVFAAVGEAIARAQYIVAKQIARGRHEGEPRLSLGVR